MTLELLMMPNLHVGQGTHLGGLSVFEDGWQHRALNHDIPLLPRQKLVGADAGAGHALAARSPGHDIRRLGWDEQLLPATVFNRRHHLMELV